MKNYKLPILGFAFMLLIVSCKKEDVQSTNTTSSSSNVSKASQWNSLSNWSTSKADNTTTYFSSLSDSAITFDVANAGLVLVYKKSGNSIQALPFQEPGNSIYWYYQVSKGSVRINSDNNNGQNLSAQSFVYFVITPQKLSTLQASGKTKLDLLQLSYDQANALLK